ncbi:SRPBCC family protein [Streptomyces yunnanensis]|uniref:Polyketide cyclase / dehydrase and lipid transport n=1 Tax=Streptomyces yunnanensis TaxID=156453 RepID=A0A9X8N2S1_9ACTN|nr:SRPBCC family protein [Streptomyces yunnanensis]SHM76797.1 Polyketide cyclase / dehydrase and lipid transport [Streptomyces yunnanensis]
MASTSVSRVVHASPEAVWNLIGGFHSLSDWLPYIPESLSEQGGRARRLTNADGEVIIEQLTAYNLQGRSYSYAILQAPFPVTGYLSTLRVHALPGRPEAAEVQWSGRFVPEGVSDEEAEALFAGIYRDGLDALAAAIETR